MGGATLDCSEVSWFPSKSAVKPKGCRPALGKTGSGHCQAAVEMVFSPVLRGAETNAMLKRLMVATFGLTLVSLSLSPLARAQSQAPIGHRQPTAADVPLNDSVRGDANISGQTPDPTPKKRSRSHRVQSNVDVIIKTPNICSNCNE
jgi:hypothetical protein